MEYIRREKASLANLKKTNDEFNLLIEGKSVKDAYQFYKDNINQFKYFKYRKK